jgi:hypothetical protein
VDSTVSVPPTRASRCRIPTRPYPSVRAAGRNPVVVVPVNHPLATSSSVSLEDLADCTLPDVEFLPRALMDAFIPPRTPSGRIFRRIRIRTLSESLMRVAAGEIVHLTAPSFVEQYHQPGVTAIPVRDMEPSRTAQQRNSTEYNRPPRPSARERKRSSLEPAVEADLCAFAELGAKAAGAA